MVAIITCRKESIFNLGSAETKLLYTLHWILLDAMDECCLEEQERGNMDYHNYNVPLSSITVASPHSTPQPAQRVILPPVADIRLPVRPHLSEHQRDGLRSEHEAHQRKKDLVSHVGVQTP